MYADKNGRSSQVKTIQRERIKGALARFLGVEQSPEWAKLPFVVRATTYLASALCLQALGEKKKSKWYVEEFRKKLEETRRNNDVLHRLLANCAHMGNKFAAAGFDETALLAEHIIKEKHLQLSQRYFRDKAHRYYWIGSMAKTSGRLEYALSVFDEAQLAAEQHIEGVGRGATRLVAQLQSGDLAASPGLRVVAIRAHLGKQPAQVEL